MILIAKRRGNNEGSIVKRSDGRWQATISVGYDDAGKLKRVSFYGKTRAEAKAKMDEALGQIKTGTFQPNRITVREWMMTWLETYAKPSVRATTFRSYEQLTRVHIIPELGGTLLKELMPAQVQRMLNTKLENLSARTVEMILIVLRAALKQAVLEGLIPRNVADIVKKPKKEKKPPRVLTNEETQLLMNESAPSRYKWMMLTILGTGLRVGEALGLKWSDIDLDKKILRVNRAIAFLGAEKIEQRPKTDTSVRDIPLPDYVVQVLIEWKAEQERERELMADNYSDNSYVFSAYNGNSLTARNFTRYLNTNTERLCIDHVNPHALRHTYATRLLEAGIHPKVAQELLGHNTITLTMDIYSHALPDVKQDAAEKLNAILIGQNPV